MKARCDRELICVSLIAKMVVDEIFRAAEVCVTPRKSLANIVFDTTCRAIEDWKIDRSIQVVDLVCRQSEQSIKPCSEAAIGGHIWIEEETQPSPRPCAGLERLH